MTAADTLPAEVKAGADCTTMLEVRAGVDALDRALVALLAQRFAYMDAAARIKPSRDAVRDEARKAQVIANASVAAAAAGLPDGLAETLWESLVEASIAYELTRWDAGRA
ncbi:chorismate mutase [Polymorphobacter fuscus]|uniref:chorismate mutase n=1 Tax=Sandarakinorhabdus fusca TaxID=1439888 RepID=A0A7C9GNK8_9SPHN|nr:chorismate mutase [Polymorphobacter fuscus]KAB7648748.1 chorismate mutase [Polymorphobacter fuscus]MQT16316.1 chorismate mutase [Polymorphobacter fuscus]NJC07397.1 isochorismate pyruvate lyase [Polymorphobacter fuscus]